MSKAFTLTPCFYKNNPKYNLLNIINSKFETFFYVPSTEEIILLDVNAKDDFGGGGIESVNEELID